MPTLNKNQFDDIAQAFQTYLTFAGDVDKTALALDLAPQAVRDLAAVERWDEKIATWNEAQKGNSEELQIKINRAVNYVQAHRMRKLVDVLLLYFSGLTKEELIEKLTKKTRDGEEFQTRAITDLVKAAEACQNMTARALGDRGTPDAAAFGKKGSHLSLLVMKAMSAADEMGLDSVAVVKKQLQNESTLPPRKA